MPLEAVSGADVGRRTRVREGCEGRDLEAREGIRARAKYIFIPGTCDKWVAGSDDGQHAHEWVRSTWPLTHSLIH